MRIAQLLEAQKKKYADKTAIIFRNENISFSQITNLYFCLANSLIKLGLRKGDKIAIYLPNCPEYIYSYLAIWSIGAIAVPLDFMLTEEELVSCIFHSEAKALIIKPKPTLSLANLKTKCPNLKEIILYQEKIVPFLTLEQLLEEEENRLLREDISPADYSCIFYTSGSTGSPKGVLCNYRQLQAPAQAMAHFADLSDKDIALCGALPFSHLGGLVFIQAIIFLGTTVVLMDRFIPSEFLKNVQQFKVTCFWLVPSMYYAILQLKEFETFDLSSLKWVNCFGAPSSADQLRRFHKYCPHAYLLHGWGMTETQGPTVVTPKSSTKIESIGLPAPWVRVKIFDDNDQELPAGRIGELVVQSWVVTDGYYKDPKATAKTLRNGWFHTGDLGRLDAEGYLYIVGRIKEMIKVAGEIVFEPEVEAAIYKHPDIAEAAVVGVTDKLRGEVPKAFVVLKQGKSLSAEDLHYFLRQHLAHFKIPHYFEFRESLPKTGSGKVDKALLRQANLPKRERMEEEFETEDEEAALEDYSYIASLMAVNYSLIADELSRLGNFQKGVAIDLGCGLGDLAIEVAKRYPGLEIVGVDISAKAIREAAKKAKEESLDNAKFELQDVHKLKFEDNSIDLVVSHGSIHHWRNVSAAFSEIYRVLKAGGVAYLADLRRDAPEEVVRGIKTGLPSSQAKGFINSIKAAYTPDELKAILNNLKIKDFSVSEQKFSRETILKNKDKLRNSPAMSAGYTKISHTILIKKTESALTGNQQ